MDKQTVLNKAAKIYRDCLWDTPKAINYLVQERGLTESILFQYKIGCAKGNILAKTARQDGWYHAAVQYGLIVGDEGTDFFEGYIIFPVFVTDNCVNIAGRSFEGHDCAHKTLPNTPKEVPYNFEVLSADAVMITEAPIDALTLLQHGFLACSTLGAAVNKQLIPHFRDKICYIAFDNDEAGKIAAMKLGKRLSWVAKKARIVRFPENISGKMDVNLFFRQTPRAKWRMKFLLKKSLPISSHEFENNQEEQTKKRASYAEDQINIVKVGKVLFKDEYITDKGNEIWVRCPNHKQGTEKNKSLWIGGKKNIFVCFGCVTGGGSVKLVMWHLKLSTEDARAWIRAHFSV